MILPGKKILGYYSVNGVVFYNKIAALRACKNGYIPEWKFQDELFSSIDWLKEPEEDLYELYRQRAIQIRTQYDQVILMYSGGIDSTTMLRTFIDNNIPLEGVGTYGTFNHTNWGDHIQNKEAYNVAVPYITKLEQEKNINLNYFMLDDSKHFDKFVDEEWVYSTSNFSLSPQTYMWNYHQTDPNYQYHMNKGYTGIIRGVDKPRIFHEDGKWKVSFLDSCPGFFNSDYKGGHENSWYANDYFYWSGELPKLICKQAYVIKNYFEALPDSVEKQILMKRLFSRDKKYFNREFYHNYIDPLLYGKYVNQKVGEERPYFTLGKAKLVNAWDKDDAFFKLADNKYQQAWQIGITHVEKVIDDRYKKDPTNFIKSGLIDIWSKDYELC